MKKKGLSAIVAGATGLTGSILLQQLLDDSRYDVVITLSRKRIPQKHPKLNSFEVDLLNPVTYENYLKGDHLFICTGTTKAKTPDPDLYYQIEHDLPLTVAQVAMKNQVPCVVAISALGANPDSRFLYNRGKGAMERDIAQLDLDRVYFVQPALIGGKREENRAFETFWKKVQRLIDPLLVGSLKKYRTIHPKIIACAMIEIAINGYHKTRIESDELKGIVLKTS